MTMAAATPILRELAGQIEAVALFVDPTAEEVKRVSGSGLFDLLQFHGDETAAFCESFDLPYMKAIKLGEGREDSVMTGAPAPSKSPFPSLLDRISCFASAKMILLDGYDSNVPGGTGKTFDWAMAASASRECDAKLVVAGGLNPANVASAVEQLKPFGVDVSSGVEASHGIKDLLKMRLFVEGASSV